MKVEQDHIGAACLAQGAAGIIGVVICVILMARRMFPSTIPEMKQIWILSPVCCLAVVKVKLFDLS